jgi:phage-related protein
MMKLAIGPKVGLDNILKGIIPKGAQTAQKMTDVDTWLKGAFTTLLPTIAPSTLTGPKGPIDLATNKPSNEEMIGNLFSMMGNDLFGKFNSVLSGVINTAQGLGKAAMTPGQDAGGLAQAGFGIKQIFANTFGAMGRQGAAAIKPLTAGFGQMFPQMAAMALVMEPLMAFIGGLLEPFSMITDMFGSFGEILGQALIPVLTTMVMPLLISMMPLFQSLSQVLAPLLQLFFAFSGLGILMQILTPLMPLINMLAGALATVMNVISPVITLFTQLFSAFISWGIGAAIQGIIGWIGSLGVNLDGLKNGFQKFVEIIGTVAELLQGVIDLIAGRITAGEFKKLGFSETEWW